MRKALVALIAVAAAGGMALALVAADLGNSAGSEEGFTLRDVVTETDRYAGEEVVVSGEIREDAGLDLSDVDLGFVLGDDAGLDLLVVAEPGTELPVSIDADTVLRVGGTVHPVDDAPERAAPLLGDDGPLAGDPPGAVLLATAIDQPANAKPTTPPRVRTVTVARLLAEPEPFLQRPLLVPGTVTAVGETGFAIRGESGRELLVGAAGVDLGDVAEGDPVQLRAELERLSAFRAARLGGLDTGAPSGEGDPFLVLRAFTGELTS